MCVCVCVWREGRGGGVVSLRRGREREKNAAPPRPSIDSPPSLSLSILLSLVEQLHPVLHLLLRHANRLGSVLMGHCLCVGGVARERWKEKRSVSATRLAHSSFRSSPLSLPFSRPLCRRHQMAGDAPADPTPPPPTAGDKPKKKICCACPETKARRGGREKSDGDGGVRLSTHALSLSSHPSPPPPPSTRPTESPGRVRHPAR